MNFGPWDIALIAVGSVMGTAMGTAIAYLRHPERKAFIRFFQCIPGQPHGIMWWPANR